MGNCTSANLCTRVKRLGYYDHTQRQLGERALYVFPPKGDATRITCEGPEGAPILPEDPVARKVCLEVPLPCLWLPQSMNRVLLEVFCPHTCPPCQYLQLIKMFKKDVGKKTTDHADGHAASQQLAEKAERPEGNFISELGLPLECLIGMTLA